MRNDAKNRDPNKARKRAGNDIATGLRKLQQWAIEQNDSELAAELVVHAVAIDAAWRKLQGGSDANA